jgi:hypothetical protein
MDAGEIELKPDMQESLKGLCGVEGLSNAETTRNDGAD